MLRGTANYVKAGTIYDDGRLAQNSGRHRSSGFGNQCYPWRSQLVLSHEIERRQQAKTVQLETAQIEARTKQQQVQTELLKQQERAAKAEKELLELQERFKGKSFLQLE